MNTIKNQVLSKIFEYENYRLLLKDYFVEQKHVRRMFSHRYFAQQAGFSSSSFVSHVMEGKKNLSLESIHKLAAGLKLSGKAARYFETMVMYNQAKTLHDREKKYSQLTQIRKATKFYKVNRQQFALYNEWYYAVVRELAVYADWNNDFLKLGKMVLPPISEEKAKNAVELLLQIGLLIKQPHGKLVQSSFMVSAENAPAVMINRLKKDYLLKAIEAEENYKKPEKYSSSSTVSMSLNNYEKAKEMIDDVRKAILAMAMEDDDVEKVFQMNYQMFPMSQQIVKAGSKTNEPVA